MNETTTERRADMPQILARLARLEDESAAKRALLEQIRKDVADIRDKYRFAQGALWVLGGIAGLAIAFKAEIEALFRR